MKPAAFAAVVLLLSAALYFIAHRGPEVTPLHPDESILAFGDSITYGFGADEHQSYPAVLQSMTGLRVINAGINGETSEEGLARLPKLLEDDSIRLMLLCLGGNDILQQRSHERLKHNLKRMIDLAKAKEIDVVLIGVPTFGILGLSSLPLYGELAEKEKVAYMPSLLPDVLGDPALKNDYIHPNAAGYRYMAEQIDERLRGLGYLD
jgi:lysophospholipase L1-like esterase